MRPLRGDADLVLIVFLAVVALAGYGGYALVRDHWRTDQEKYEACLSDAAGQPTAAGVGIAEGVCITAHQRRQEAAQARRK